MSLGCLGALPITLPCLDRVFGCLNPLLNNKLQLTKSCIAHRSTSEQVLQDVALWGLR